MIVAAARVETERVDDRTRFKSYITLDNGETYICWSANIARALQRIAPSDFPIKARFTLENNAGRTYWTFE